ncbi:MAG: hypothetical protein IK084_03545 [Bacteroidaceae bacterium]|nr:hypothetical protein [Bacteroidaceae bacterium]
MKTISRMSRWFGALAALLLLAVVPFTLTSCGDDDDDATLMFDGVKITPTSAELYDYWISENEEGSVKCYYAYLYGTTEDGMKCRIGFEFHSGLFGKTKSLTDDLTWYNTASGDNYGNGWVGFWLEEYDEEDGYWDDYDYYYTDEGDFKSGTISVNLKDGKFIVNTQDVTYDDEAFNFKFSGKYKKVESSDKVKGEVKAKVQAKAKAKK